LRVGFYLFDEFGERNSSREVAENMNVVSGAVNRQGGTLMVLQDDSRIGVELLTNIVRLKKGRSMFGAEDQMDENLGERLSHWYLFQLRTFGATSIHSAILPRPLAWADLSGSFGANG
jgi:hypothetical protein